MKNLRIVFMGTPDFAVGILKEMVAKKHTIVGVVTAPDKPAGRGQKIAHSAVKEFALTHNIKLLQPTNLKDDYFLKQLKDLDANLQVVVAFRMLPEAVWKMPTLGTFNLHASLLPQYRGAAPINWAIINGETKTGVTTFFIDEKIDTGAIIGSKSITIEENYNVGILHDKLMEIGSELVLETLERIKAETIKTTIQPEYKGLKTAYKLNKENCKIDWSKNSKTIYNQIRGLSPYPCAWCFFENKKENLMVKIYDASYSSESHEYPIGKLICTKEKIKIATTDGFIFVEALQLPGKKKMNAKELLNGIQFSGETVVK